MLGTGETDEVDEFLRLAVEIVLAHEAPFRRHRVGDVAHDREPREQRVALEDHRAVEARAFDRLIVDDHGTIRRRLESGQNVEYRGLAATGVADDADEFTACHRQPQLLEYRRAAARRRKAFADAFNGDEFIGHGTTHAMSSPRKRTHVPEPVVMRLRFRGDDSGARGGAVILLTPETSLAASRARESGRAPCRRRRSPGSR